jgi:hypothetical protein
MLVLRQTIRYSCQFCLPSVLSVSRHRSRLAADGQPKIKTAAMSPRIKIYRATAYVRPSLNKPPTAQKHLLRVQIRKEQMRRHDPACLRSSNGKITPVDAIREPDPQSAVRLDLMPDGWCRAICSVTLAQKQTGGRQAMLHNYSSLRAEPLDRQRSSAH